MSYGPILSLKCAKSEWVTSVKEIWSRGKFFFVILTNAIIAPLPSSFPHHFCSLCVSGCDGLQQRRAAVPPAGDREQRGRDVLRWSHRPAEGQEEEEEEEGAGHPDHRLNPYGHSGLFVYKHPLPISSQLSPEASRCWFLYVMNFWSDVTQCYSATRFISQINCIGLFLTVLQVLWGAFKTNKSSAAERNVVCIHSSSLCCCSSL